MQYLKGVKDRGGLMYAIDSRAMTAPGAAREDWRILCDLAHAVGRPHGFTYPTFRDLQDDFFLATRGTRADYSGLSAERLDRAQWAVPRADGPDTPLAYAATYPTPDGLATLHVPRLPTPERATPHPTSPALQP